MRVLTVLMSGVITSCSRAHPFRHFTPRSRVTTWWSAG
jgi:hypothetical protein